MHRDAQKNVFHTWKSIEDLPENWRELRSSELASIATIWTQQAERLKNSQSLKKFNERLSREWAIETGIIENVYALDRGITQLLIEKGIEESLIPERSSNKPAAEVVSIIRSHEEALEALFDFVSSKRELSVSYIKQLHQVFMENQESTAAVDALGKRVLVPLIKGDWKKNPNNPTREDGSLHQYCPPEQVQSEMERLIRLHLEHLQQEVPPEIEAAWLHHRFTQIHPFQDGNGRIARALASLIFLRFNWFPLSIHRDLRAEYIDALEQADQGDLQPLVQVFSTVQNQVFRKALSISEDVLEEKKQVNDVLRSALTRFQDKWQKKEAEKEAAAATIGEALKAHAYRKFEDISKEIIEMFSSVDTRFKAFAVNNRPEDSHWYKTQIVTIANKLDYFANTSAYKAWVGLKIREERQTEIIISFHGLGIESSGMMAASAFILYREKAALDGPHQICRDVFQFAYNENLQQIEKRFEKWLNDVIMLGLDEWRRQL